jgi:starvation-inducible DNA-binding protein
MDAKIGIKQKFLAKGAYELSKVLADEFVLYTKTRNAHWNVIGPDFHAAHIFFEDQYEALDEIMDDVAERMRALGHYAPATLKEYLKLTSLSEQTREKNTSQGFIKQLLYDHETLVIQLRGYIQTFADEFEDTGTSDFVTSLMEKHEKMAWMLRSHLE